MTYKEFQVLLIDDDEEDFIFIQDLLNEIPHAKYNLIWHPSYKDGKAALESSPLDICLLDYQLGEYTGLDLLQKAKILKNSCPIILLTGQGDFEIDLRAMNVGAADYLAKDQLTAPLLERTLRYSMKRALDIQEIDERKENFKILFNSTFEGIAIHNCGIIADVNDSFCDIFGKSRSLLINTQLKELVRNDYQQFCEEKFNSENWETFECIAQRGDESEISIEASSRKIKLKDKNYSLIAIRDFTYRKQMEAKILQQDRLASLGLLASSLAHEIGNPLGVIRGRAQLAKNKTNGNSSLESDMDTIAVQIERISQLVNSLLHLARNKKTQNVEKVSFLQVIDGVYDLVKFELKKKNIEFEVRVSSDVFVMSESSQLSQVFLNLIINSIHAIEEAKEKGIKRNHKILIGENTSNQLVKIFVQDTGIGISKENMVELFKPFFTTKGIGLGTGLGLATSFKLVESWGGLLSATSSIEQGAEFILTLNAPN